MKLKTRQETEVIRITLIKKGAKSAALTLEETTLKEVVSFVMDTVSKVKVNPVYKGKMISTAIQIRKYIGSKPIEASVNFRVFFWNPTAISKILELELINLSKK